MSEAEILKKLADAVVACEPETARAAAEEALKIAAGLTPVSVGSLLILDTLSWEFTRMKLASDPDCPVCAKYR